MAGGSTLRPKRGIRPGDELVATRSITDIRERSGRTGPLIFLETQTVVETVAGELVLTDRTTLIAR
jgi:hydroxyacyl-ACP dehydratase HTD2-like protein with hotdog domain